MQKLYFDLLSLVDLICKSLFLTGDDFLPGQDSSTVHLGIF